MSDLNCVILGISEPRDGQQPLDVWVVLQLLEESLILWSGHNDVYNASVWGKPSG